LDLAPCASALNNDGNVAGSGGADGADWGAGGHLEFDSGLDLRWRRAEEAGGGGASLRRRFQ